MNRQQRKLHERLERWVFQMIMTDPTLIESLQITSEDFASSDMRAIVKELEQEPRKVPLSLLRYLKNQMEVEPGPEGVKAAIVERLKFFKGLSDYEDSEPLLARFARFEDIIRRRNGE